LIKAYKRGVKVITLIFDDVNIDVPWSNFFHYKKRKVIEKHIGELSVVIDNEKSIVLQADRNQSHAVISSHPITVITTKNYIKHDIYVNKLIHDFENTIIEYYGENLENLINIL